MNILLLMMGGKGVRFGADIPKQYTLVKGRPVFSYIVTKYARMSEIDRMIVVSHGDWLDYVRSCMSGCGLKMPWDVVAGGATRSESVFNGLKKAMEYGGDGDVVLIHDATHPYVDMEGTREIIRCVKRCGGATLGGLEHDTMYRMNEDGFIDTVIPRQLVVSGASPEAFILQSIYPIYASASAQELESMTSAGAIALAHGIPMKVVPTETLNLKITHPGDMELFKHLLDCYFFAWEQGEEDEQSHS